MNSKTCCRCKRAKRPADFYPDKSKKDGLSSTCRPCVAVQTKEWRTKNADKKKADAKAYYEKNRDRIIKKSAAWRKADPELTQARRKNEYAKAADAIRARAKRWYWDNRERVRQHGISWRAANPDRSRIRSLAWRHNNIEKAKALTSRAKARRRGCSVATLGATEWGNILEYFDRRCAYCLKRLSRPTVDHVIAITRGGPHDLTNVVPACKTCNSRKHDLPIFMMARYAHL